MVRFLVALALLCGAVSLQAQQMYGIGLVRGVNVDVPCESVALPPLRPDFQAAYSGVYTSFTGNGNKLVYTQEGSTARIMVALGTSSWAEGEIDVTGKKELLIPLYDPRPAPVIRVGEIKMCSPSFSSDRPVLCTNIHARAAIGGRLVFPVGSPALIADGLERFGDQQKCLL